MRACIVKVCIRVKHHVNYWEKSNESQTVVLKQSILLFENITMGSEKS